MSTYTSMDMVTLGGSIIAKIRDINKAKLVSGAMSEAQFVAMMADPVYEKIERMIWNGSHSYAKALIQATDNTYYSADDKAEIINLIDQYNV